MTSFEMFPDVDYPVPGDYEYGGRHFHVQKTQDFVHDTFEVQLCIPASEDGSEFDRHSGYLELSPAGWIAVSSLSAMPQSRLSSKPLKSWQDALVAWF